MEKNKKELKKTSVDDINADMGNNRYILYSKRKKERKLVSTWVLEKHASMIDNIVAEKSFGYNSRSDFIREAIRIYLTNFRYIVADPIIKNDTPNSIQK